MLLRRFRPSVRVDTASASPSKALSPELESRPPRRLLDRWRQSPDRPRALSPVLGFRRGRPAPEPPPSQSSVLGSPETGPSGPSASQQPPFLSAHPLTPHRVGDLGQPCDSQCCSIPNSTRGKRCSSGPGASRSVAHSVNSGGRRIRRSRVRRTERNN